MLTGRCDLRTDGGCAESHAAAIRTAATVAHHGKALIALVSSCDALTQHPVKAAARAARGAQGGCRGPARREPARQAVGGDGVRLGVAALQEFQRLAVPDRARRAAAVGRQARVQQRLRLLCAARPPRSAPRAGRSATASLEGPVSGAASGLSVEQAAWLAGARGPGRRRQPAPARYQVHQVGGHAIGRPTATAARANTRRTACSAPLRAGHVGAARGAGGAQACGGGRRAPRLEQAAGGDALAARVDAAVQLLARARQEEAAHVVVGRAGAVEVQLGQRPPRGQRHLQHARQPISVVGLPAQPAAALCLGARRRRGAAGQPSCSVQQGPVAACTASHGLDPGPRCNQSAQRPTRSTQAASAPIAAHPVAASAGRTGRAGPPRSGVRVARCRDGRHARLPLLGLAQLRALGRGSARQGLPAMHSCCAWSHSPAHGGARPAAAFAPPASVLHSGSLNSQSRGCPAC